MRGHVTCHLLIYWETFDVRSVSVDRCVLKEKIKGKLTSSHLVFALLPAEGCICL